MFAEVEDTGPIVTTQHKRRVSTICLNQRIAFVLQPLTLWLVAMSGLIKGNVCPSVPLTPELLVAAASQSGQDRKPVGLDSEVIFVEAATSSTPTRDPTKHTLRIDAG